MSTDISQAKKATHLSGFFLNLGAGNETRTRDPDLGKVVLYQLSYSRLVMAAILYAGVYSSSP